MHDRRTPPQTGTIRRDVAVADTTPFRPKALALIERLDIRAATAIAESRRLAGEQVVALHVIEVGEDVAEIAADWMCSPQAAMPLVTTEMRSTLAETVVDAVGGHLVHPATRLTVVLGRWFVPPPWQRLVVPRTGDRIARALAQIDRVSVVEVGIDLDPNGW